MVSAIVLLTVKKDRVNTIAEELAEMGGIREVYSVTGRYDLVAIVRAMDSDSLADLVTNRVLAVEGIAESETLVAFRTYSRHDLERMFSIGFEER